MPQNLSQPGGMNLSYRSLVTMQGRFSGQPSALERAQQQLQGKRLGVGSSGGHQNQEKRREANDLDVYLSKLTSKVSIAGGKKQQSTLNDDLISDLSNGGNYDDAPTNLSASRFVKKSQSQTLDDSGSRQRKSESGSASMKKSATTPSFLNKTAPVYASAALQKAAKLGARFAKQTRSAENLPNSESDFDISLSDDDNKLKTKLPKGKARSKEKPFGAKKASSLTYLPSSDEDNVQRDSNKFVKKKSTKPSFYVGDNEEDEDDFGQDGSKFLKKSVAKQPTASKDDAADGSRFLKKSKKRDTNETVAPDKNPPSKRFDNLKSDFLTSTPKKDSDIKSEKPKVSRTAERTFGLDSDEEDLEEFIMNLSPSSSPDIPPIREKKKTQTANQTEESKQPSKEKSSFRRPATPAASKVFTSRDLDSPSSDSVAVEESAESIVTESIDEEGDFLSGLHTNIMQLEDLEPLGVNASSAAVVQLSKIKPSSAIAPNKDIISETSEHIDRDIFAGLQTVDDLLVRGSSVRTDQRGEPVGYSSDFEIGDEIRTDSISEILSEVTDTVKRVRSPGEVYADDTFTSNSESLSQSKTSTRTVPDTHSEVTSEEDTRRRAKRSDSDSEDGQTRTKTSRRYSDDFASGHTDSEVEDFTTDDEKTRTSVTHSRSFTSYTESRTVTKSEKVKMKGRKAKCQDAAVQADGASSATHRWLRDLDLSALGTVTGIDPTPVAMHIINPQALDALTSYSPSILAMNETFLSQLRHTQDSIQSSLRLHQAMTENIETDYSYTTLEETQEYIRRHRRPKLTMEEAMEEVRQEMEEGYR